MSKRLIQVFSEIDRNRTTGNSSHHIASLLEEAILGRGQDDVYDQGAGCIFGS